MRPAINRPHSTWPRWAPGSMVMDRNDSAVKARQSSLPPGWNIYNLPLQRRLKTHRHFCFHGEPTLPSKVNCPLACPSSRLSLFPSVSPFPSLSPSFAPQFPLPFPPSTELPAGNGAEWEPLSSPQGRAVRVLPWGSCGEVLRSLWGWEISP